MDGLLFLNVPYKEYISIVIIISFLMTYFKKSGFIIYLLTMAYISNEIFIKDIFSSDFLYAIIYMGVPSILGLDAILKKDIDLNIKHTIFLIPVGLYYILPSNFEFSGDSITIAYSLFLIYALYLNFKGELNNIIAFKCMLMILLLISSLYILTIYYPDLIHSPKSQVSFVIGFTGIFLIAYRLRH